MAGEYFRWYREGTVKTVNGSTAIVGTNTYWLTAGLHPGDMFSTDGVTEYEVNTVTDDTHITLKTAYQGVSNNTATYRIIRNFTASLPSELAAKATLLYGDLMRYWNQDTQTVHGKSAYEIACQNGYTGTESQWLESLKAAGEWETLNARTQLMTSKSAAYANSVWGGRNLGTAPTAAQIRAIKNQDYSQFKLGDYFTPTFDGVTGVAQIFGFQPTYGMMPNDGGDGICIGLWFYASYSAQQWCFPINDTATCEGHILNSKLYTEYLPEILEKIAAWCGGEDNLVNMPDNVAEAIDTSTGNVSRRTLTKGRIFLPSFYNLTGIMSNPENTGWQYLGRLRWPMMRFTSPWKLNQQGMRLSENANATKWRYLNGNGVGTGTADANSTYWPVACVKPYVLLK